MVKITIDGQSLEVEPGTSILNACRMVGIEVPVFCYHPRLTVAGNCRMCLVEVEKSPKPVASCATIASEGMVIFTKSDLAQKAQNGALEFLLINHPLDCPICDQGGRCDLQDIAMSYGRGSSRFELNKRSVKAKYMGPLIKTVMTRCIHCTRCIRFADEIAGAPELATLGRGEHMEITSYLEGAVSSELAGNMIDICPVGALTSKPYSFKGRPWELKKTPAIDIFDGVGSPIQIDSRGPEVMRILPRVCEEINEEWISDKVRFAYDGLKYQRLSTPYIRHKGKLKPATWDEAFKVIASEFKKVSPSEMGALAGPMVDNETLFLTAQLWDQLGSPHLDVRPFGGHWPHTSRSHYIFNTSIEGLEQAQAVLLIGTNPRWEAPVLNARLRKVQRLRNIPIAHVGSPFKANYPLHHFGNSPADLLKILDSDFGNHLKNAQRPLVILGEEALAHENAPGIWDFIQTHLGQVNWVSEDWVGINVLSSRASLVGGIDLGFIPGHNGFHTRQIIEKSKSGNLKILVALGFDEVPLETEAFKIYVGHHGDINAPLADVILPGSAFSEKTALYTNTEGRVQKSHKAVEAPGEAKEDWKIIRRLFDVLNLPCLFNDQEMIWQALAQKSGAYDKLDTFVKTPWVPLKLDNPKLGGEPFKPTVPNFYMHDSISRHSPTMAACVREILQGKDAA
jgi:NADH-quinone oxidoreductase subunit G